MISHESPASRPLITLISDRLIQEFRAPETSDVFDKLDGIEDVLSTAGLSQTGGVDVFWLLLRNVNQERLRAACHRILRTHDSTLAPYVEVSVEDFRAGPTRVTQETVHREESAR